jgi:hypothetical protein
MKSVRIYAGPEFFDYALEYYVKFNIFLIQKCFMQCFTFFASCTMMTI